MFELEFEKVDGIDFFASGSIVEVAEIGDEITWELANLARGDYYLLILSGDEYESVRDALAALQEAADA